MRWSPRARAPAARRHELAERHDAEARRLASVAFSLAQRDGTPREMADARTLYAQGLP
jgi:hypothetical protein